MQNKLNPLVFPIVLFFLSYASSIYAQTNVGITAGVDMTRTRFSPTEDYFQVGDSSFRNADILYGVRIEQRMAKSFFLSFQFDYTQKRIDAYTRGIIPYEQFGFSRYRTALAFHWMPFRFLNIGAGPAGHYMPKVDIYLDGEILDDTPYKRKEIGAMFFSGFYYRHLFIEANYYKGIKAFEKNGRIFQPLRSINFTLSYLVKLHRKKKGDKTRRERF